MEKPIVTGTALSQDEIKYEEPIKEQPEVMDHDQTAYTNGQNGTPAWADSQGNARQDNNFGDAAVEEESRGIGIKEDG